MDIKKLSIIITTLIVTTFMAVFIIQGNYEFIAYIAVLYIILAFIYFTDKQFNYRNTSIIGLCSWVLMHMAGGSLFIAGTKLYDFMLIPIIGEPYNIFKYDQFVHFYCYIIIAMILFDIAKKHIKINNITVIVILILAATGIGAINEIIEFLTVVFLHSTGVGGYTNNALDLIFNLAGATVGILLSKKVKY